MGRFVLAAAAAGAFGWPWAAGVDTTLGLVAVGLILTPAASPAVPRVGGWRERTPGEL